MTWVKLPASLPSHPLWRDLWAPRLLVWLLCHAQNANGVVMFSYPVAARQLALVDGRTPREPSRKVLRRALQELERIGLVSVMEWVQGWEQARNVGGAQGYLTVRFRRWPLEHLDAEGRGTGSNENQGTGSVGDRATKGYTKKRERDQKTPSESSSTRDASRADDTMISGSPAGRILDAIRASQTPFIGNDARVTPAWARSMVAAYPTAATAAEVARADAWCQSHPARSRRRKSATKFLRGWFERGAEKARSSPRTTGVPAVAPPSIQAVDALERDLRAAQEERRASPTPQRKEPAR